MMFYVQQAIVSLLASIGFGLLFNVPMRAMLQSGIAGMVGWLVYVWGQQALNHVILSTLAAALMVTVVSQFFARVHRKPFIVYSVAGIIPLVPGGLAYDAMRHIVENHYDLAVQSAMKAFMISGAIASGLIFSEILNQLLRKRPKKVLNER